MIHMPNMRKWLYLVENVKNYNFEVRSPGWKPLKKKKRFYAIMAGGSKIAVLLGVNGPKMVPRVTRVTILIRQCIIELL